MRLDTASGSRSHLIKQPNMITLFRCICRFHFLHHVHVFSKVVVNIWFFATKIFVACGAFELCYLQTSSRALPASFCRQKASKGVININCFTIKSFVSHVSSPSREEQLYTRKFMWLRKTARVDWGYYKDHTNDNTFTLNTSHVTVEAARGSHWYIETRLKSLQNKL